MREKEVGGGVEELFLCVSPQFPCMTRKHQNGSQSSRSCEVCRRCSYSALLAGFTKCLACNGSLTPSEVLKHIFLALLALPVEVVEGAGKGWRGHRGPSVIDSRQEICALGNVEKMNFWL